jgi:uncharacterized membrane protein
MKTISKISFKNGKGRVIALCAMIMTAWCGAVRAQSGDYTVTALPSLGGTSSRGDSINNRSWIAGFSNLPGDTSRHAALWRDGANRPLIDLGTLGGPNSSVTWNVKSDRGLVAGIAQTDLPEPLGEAWSSAFFFPPPNNVGFITLGFSWKNGQMTALPTLGGNNGFAAGANNRNEIAGWAENTCHDPTCVPPQVLQFRPVIYGPNDEEIRELPLIPGDTSGAATAINDQHIAIGISGICDQAVGRYTAKHAVVWRKDQPIDIGNLGAEFWNTPTAINQGGTVVGFAGDPAFPEGDIVHGFIWTKNTGIQPLGPLPNRVPAHVDSEPYGINDQGQAVGVSCDADFIDCRGVIWENGEVTDLNELKNADFTGFIDQAKDINNAGEITGRAIDPVTGVKNTIVAVPAD